MFVYCLVFDGERHAISICMYTYKYKYLHTDRHKIGRLVKEYKVWLCGCWGINFPYQTMEMVPFFHGLGGRPDTISRKGRGCGNFHSNILLME